MRRNSTRSCAQAPKRWSMVSGLRAAILAQALVETGERVVPREALVLRQHAAFLRVEQKDQAQDD